MTPDLFDDEPVEAAAPERLGPGTLLLRAAARAQAAALLEAVDTVSTAAPWRHMCTPGGRRLSVAMSNCGTLGWTSDRHGYRYTRQDPQTGRPWPAMPAIFLSLARTAARQAGHADFEPDACLINLYTPGTRLGLHQDRDERDLDAPIVSVSLGVPAVFLFGGLQRSDPVTRLVLGDGDVLVWGGPDRLRHHGIAPLKQACHARLGACRINLTLRRAG
ncbi:DNA-N1-methyladenine dioxygenase [Sphaerotilus hippei]|uniref:DNA-N1-methyladenine dioxygenase n=2 Tax=Sphaerotilus hippei TaxID=744406 RepID=A0A318H253_9BURK|nr:DNA oxidative demethylase AlkB [Sphaerotilus hippei]PXW97419.1 DNA-N1-methyladenine dioxygenase [Sphaerotilus hippei]